MKPFSLFVILLSIYWALSPVAFAAEPAVGANLGSNAWRAGLAKVDITPKEPVRMAGYGNRDRPSEGVDSPLAVRCLALAHGEDDSPRLLISIDTIGIPGALSRQISQLLLERHGIRRDALVLASTHTHCGPDLVSELSNIFATPLSDAEREAGLRYKAQLVDGILQAAAEAIADLSRAHVDFSTGKATFAANRRVLTGGRWSGFGVQEDGPVDHSVGVLRITTPDGGLRGIVFNYACHATTLGGDHYRINGDWPGFASETLEARHEGLVALSTIGCGADANPLPRGKLEDAVTHGRNLADEIDRVTSGEMRPVASPIQSQFDHAALSFELPTIEEVGQRAEDPNPQTRRHAQQLEAVYKREGRLPATYPVPIQAWRFGDQLTMIFLGGEVVVDYALRLKRELADDELWVTAYAGDVLGYIASERMRHEGGYEYDRSAIYYGLPGPWAAGSEDALIDQIHAMLKSAVPQSPVSAADALGTIRLSSDEFRVELVAAEPQVQDPINLAFGADGRLWVVEMGDYPTGDRGGRIKFLEDTTGDGTYDKATIFLDELSFPTGVFPWRDGVLITAAPDILFARDTDGDGRADDVEKLYSGFALANPQHRISGFTYGLDHSLHCASGDNLGKITSNRTGDEINASGHDVQIWPDNGAIATLSGRTQYIRSRDDWGHWFGNDNSRPMYHYPVDAAYLRRNGAVAYAASSQQLFDPPAAPPVFPLTSAAVRYNDLFAANRFTSACSSIISRSEHFDVDGRKALFVCEPVHNLVHRGLLVPSGASYRAERSALEQDREFLASTDPWFRAVRCAIGPDGALWVVDMYRETIEHPNWIPQAWQQQLDLTAGSDRGRIFRVLPRTSNAPLPQSITELSSGELIARLDAPSGPLRDLVTQLIIERYKASGTSSAADEEALIHLASGSGTPQGRVHALAVLSVTGRLDDQVILAALHAEEPGVLAFAIALAESRLGESKAILKRLGELSGHPEPRVSLALALALGQSTDSAAGRALSQIASRSDLDPWLASAVLSSAAPHARALLGPLLEQLSHNTEPISPATLALLSGLLDTASAGGDEIADLVRGALHESQQDDAALDKQLAIAVSVVRSASKQQASKAAALESIQPLYQRALTIAVDDDLPEARRIQALELVGIGLGDADYERQLLIQLLSPATAAGVQRQAVTALQRADPDGFVTVLLSRWGSMTTALRAHGVSVMLTRQSWTDRLLAALEQRSVGVHELTAAARQQLLHTGTRSMRVRAQRLMQSTGTPHKQQLVEQTLSQFTSGGDLTSGAALYSKHCAVCHQADEQGRTIGPSLENLTDRSDRALIEAILDPNRAVDPHYQSYTILTDEDEILVGAIESEVAETITLARPDGTRAMVNRRRIAEIKNSGVSLMPEGFESLLTPAQLQAIVRYLQQPPAPAE